MLPTSIEALRLQAARRRQAGGLVAESRQLPFGCVADEAEGLAAWLDRQGIRRGDRIALCAANHPALVLWHFAGWAVGAVLVPLAARSTADEIVRMAGHARVRVLVADEDRAATVREAATRLGLPAFVSAAAPPLRPRALRRVAIHPVAAAQSTRGPLSPHALAVIAYTSGTTGHPKGVRLSHANLLWATLSCSAARGDREDGVALCLSPLTHTPVFVSHLLCRLMAGQTAVVLEKFAVGDVLEAIDRWKVTDVPLIAGMVFPLIEQRSVPRRVRECVRKVSVGGAATPMASKERLADLFPHAEIIEAYGQSESTDGVVMARGRDALERLGTIGRPNPFVAVDVLRPDGGPAGVGEVGELCIAGPTVMQGYERDRAATRAARREGWLRSGDLGRRDADGFLYITGRLKDLIITGGENVAPLEVEEVLRSHPAVADVAVVGTPHPRWGEQVAAAVVLAPGHAIDADALVAFAGRRLASFKRPRRVAFLDRLPRNAANKVEAAKLKAMLAESD